MNIRIYVDVTCMYFALRKLGSTFNYAAFPAEVAKWLGAPDQANIQSFGYTLFAPANTKQQKFINTLQELGYTITLKEAHAAAAQLDPHSFLPEMFADLANAITEGQFNTEDVAVFVTDDVALCRASTAMPKVDCVACFFSELLRGPWVTAIANDTVQFMDMSGDIRPILLSRFYAAQ